MLVAKQRQDLIDGDLFIPTGNTIDLMAPYTQLKEWTRVLRQDDDGYVFTPAGIFLSIDLEFKELN